MAAIHEAVKEQDVAISFDECTDARGKSILHMVVRCSDGKSLLADVMTLECLGQNDGYEHKEVPVFQVCFFFFMPLFPPQVAAKVTESLSGLGIRMSRVKAVVVDEGSVMLAAYRRELGHLLPHSKLLVCTAHKLHGVVQVPMQQ